MIPVAYMRDVQFYDDSLGWAVGDEGLIVRQGEPFLCSEPLGVECEDPDVLTPVLDPETDCIIEFTCTEVEIELDEFADTDEEDEDCLDLYRECVEEDPDNYADCDGTFEFCEGIGEVLEEVQCESAYNACLESNEGDCQTDYESCLSGEEETEETDSSNVFLIFDHVDSIPGSAMFEKQDINLYIASSDGTEAVFGAVLEGDEVTEKEAFEKPGLSIYMSYSTLKDIEDSEDQKTTTLDAIKNGDIVIKGNNIVTTVKVFFMKIGLAFAAY